MTQFFSPPKLKTYAGLFVNISAAYFMATAISINFTKFNQLDTVLVSVQYIFSGILYLFVAIKIEEYLYYGKFY